MNIEKIEFDRIHRLLLEREQSMQRGNFAAKQVLIEPLPPSFVNSQEDWNRHLDALRNFKSLSDAREAEIEISAVNAEHIESLIIGMIPANVWVKVGNYHVGYETDTWPGHKPQLLIRKDADQSELRELKHRLNRFD